MRISEIFTMGGGRGRHDDSCYAYCDSDECNAGNEAIDDPRLKRHGLAAFIGSRADGGSGLAALFEDH